MRSDYYNKMRNDLLRGACASAYEKNKNVKNMLKKWTDGAGRIEPRYTHENENDKQKKRAYEKRRNISR